MGKTFVTGCTHFGHANILRFQPNRPWKTIEEMDEHLIRAWNETVGHDDNVFHLGDFAFRNAKARATYFNRLNGRKRLVIGNHDNIDTTCQAWHSAPTHYLELEHLGTDEVLRRFVLCHYPIESWHHLGRDNVYHLHAHTHGHLPSDTQRIDVSVDGFGGKLNNFGPVELTELVRAAHRLLPKGKRGYRHEEKQ